MTGTRAPGDSREAALGLAWLGHAAGSCLLRFLSREGAEGIWGASRRRLRDWGMPAATVAAFEAHRVSFDMADAEAVMARAGVWFVPFGSGLYAPELVHLQIPPAGLFVRGKEEAVERLAAVPRVTIVGTRKATTYGTRSAEAFASAFAARGVAVVSGLALGVDGRAHQAALEAGGCTVAVLGCGVDVVYPRRHRWLYEKVAAKGALLSELPPGSAPTRWTFPHRNRLLAALGDAVLVVEASKTSGALQTANWALDLGRPVFSVPGPIQTQGHEGCNMLLYEGAGAALDPLVTVEDFLLQTRMERGGQRTVDGCTRAVYGAGTHDRPLRAPDSRGEAVLGALLNGPSSVDGLMESTGLAVREVNAALAGLELAGLVMRSGPGIYIRAP